MYFGENVEFGSVLFGAETPNQGLCVIDGSDQKILCFDRAGKLRFSVGRRGEGPGESTGLYRLAVSPTGRVFGLDFARQMVNVYDPGGKFERSLRLPIPFSQVLSFLAPTDSLLVLTATAFDAGRASDFGVHTFRVSDSLVYLTSFGPLPETNDRRVLSMFGSGIATLTPRGTLLYSRRYPYDLFEFSLDGTQVLTVQGPVHLTTSLDELIEVNRSATKTTFSYVGAEKPERVGSAYDGGNGRWYVMRTDKDGHKLFDVFDARTGRWLPSIPSPIRDPDLSLLGMDFKNGFYLGSTLCDDAPCVLRDPLKIRGP
ncbi:MAG TPA: 6-bladed beta-propeller [Gemmatimonadales bacterium]|nr:6-bladed beta-propeller [Gemmatimonadales bacterium]